MDAALIRKEEVWGAEASVPGCRRKPQSLHRTDLSYCLNSDGITSNKKKCEDFLAHPSKEEKKITMAMLYSIKQWAMRLFRKWQKHDISAQNKKALDGCGTSRCKIVSVYFGGGGGDPFVHQEKKTSWTSSLL